TRQKVSMGRFFFYSRWHDEAVNYYREVAAFGDLPIEPAYYQALNLIELHQTDEALRIAERLQRSIGSTLSYLAGVAELYALCDAKDKAARLIDQHKLLSPGALYSSYRKARLSIALGDEARTLQLLQHSLEHKEPELPWLAVDPRL